MGVEGVSDPPAGYGLRIFLYYVISCLAYVRPGDEKSCCLSVFSCLSTKPRGNKCEILGQNFKKSNWNRNFA